MENRNYYAIIKPSAYKLEVKRQKHIVHRVRLFSSYPGGSDQTDVQPEEAEKLIKTMVSHAVSESDYNLQVRKNASNAQQIEKRG